MVNTQKKTAWSCGRNRFSFVSNHQTVFQRGCSISYSHSQEWELLAAFGVVRRRANRCVVVFPCCFSLQFPNDRWCGLFFDILIFYLYVFLGEVTVQVFCPFKKNGLFIFFLWSSALYILDNSFLSNVSFAIFFSQSVTCLPSVLISSIFLDSVRYHF